MALSRRSFLYGRRSRRPAHSKAVFTRLVRFPRLLPVVPDIKFPDRSTFKAVLLRVRYSSNALITFQWWVREVADPPLRTVVCASRSLLMAS